MDNQELTELIEKLGLQNHSYTFSVVTIDSENYVTGSYIESADDLEEQGILSQFDEDFCHDDTVRAEISYYIIGQSEADSEQLPDEFRCDIVSHLHWLFYFSGESVLPLRMYNRHVWETPVHLDYQYFRESMHQKRC